MHKLFSFLYPSLKVFRGREREELEERETDGEDVNVCIKRLTAVSKLWSNSRTLEVILARPAAIVLLTTFGTFTYQLPRGKLSGALFNF